MSRTPPIDRSHVEELRHILSRLGLQEFHVAKHSPCLRVEAIDEQGNYPVLRLRRDTVHLWILELPKSTNRWETTPYRATMPELMNMVVADFGWLLAAHQNPV
jgi:hypothetical protein